MQKINLLIFKFSKIFKQKKYLFFAAVFAVVVAGLIFPNNNVYAGSWDGSSSWSLGEGLAGLVLGLISPIIYIIFYIILWIAYAVAWIGTDIINITLSPSVMNSVLNISSTSSLYQAWAIFRDIANLLFILILLLVAFGTIFQSGDYNIKKSLPKIILVAFLINFSAMITGVIIDFTNILMFGIFKMMCPVDPVSLLPSATCTQDFMKPLWDGVVNPIFHKYAIMPGFLGGFKAAASVAIAAVYVLIFGLVLIALGIFFLIRIAAFALLIVLSPLAFFGEVVPSLNSISKKWWDNLWQYSFFGPIAALLLYVSAIMAKNTIAIPVAIFDANPEMSWLQSDISMIVSSIIPLIFLFAIIPITRSMGIAMAGAVMDKTVGLASKAGAFAGSAADRYLARGAAMTPHKDDSGVKSAYKWARRGLSTASPGSWKRAWKEKQRLEEGDYKISTGRIQGGMGWNAEGQASPVNDAGVRAAREQLKELDIKNADELADKIAEAIQKGDKFMSAEGMRTLASTGDIEKILDRMYGSHEAKDYNRLMNEEIKPMWGETETAKLSGEIGKAEEKNGHFIYNGHGDYDPKRGKGKEYYMHDMFERNPDNSIKQEDGKNLMNDGGVKAQKKAMLNRWNSKDEFARIRSLGKTNFEGKKDKDGKETPSEEGAILLAELKGSEALDRVKGLTVKVARYIEDNYGAEFKKVEENKKGESIFKNMDVDQIKTVRAVYDRIKQNSEGKGDSKKKKEDEDEDEEQRRQDEGNQS